MHRYSWRHSNARQAWLDWRSGKRPFPTPAPSLKRLVRDPLVAIATTLVVLLGVTSGLTSSASASAEGPFTPAASTEPAATLAPDDTGSSSPEPATTESPTAEPTEPAATDPADPVETSEPTDPAPTEQTPEEPSEQPADNDGDQPAADAPVITASVAVVPCRGFVVYLTGDPESGSQVRITHDGTSQQVDVGAGKRLSIDLSSPADVTATVVVTDASGLVLAELTDAPTCVEAEPTASVDVDCTGFQVSIRNPGSLPVDVTIDSSTGLERRVTIEPAGSQVVTLPTSGVAGDSVEVAYQDTVLATGTLSADCAPAELRAPQTDIEVDCGGWTIEMDNSASTTEVTFSIYDARGDRSDVTVAAGATDTVTLPALGRGTVTVMADGQTEMMTFSGACARAGANAATATIFAPLDACGQTRVVLDNSANAAAATFVVSQPDDSVKDVWVSGSTRQTVINPASDRSYVLWVSVQGDVIASQRIPACNASGDGGDTGATPGSENGGETGQETGSDSGAEVTPEESPAETLPNTGAPSGPWAGPLGAGLLGLGLVLIAMGRRTHRALA